MQENQNLATNYAQDKKNMEQRNNEIQQLKQTVKEYITKNIILEKKLQAENNIDSKEFKEKLNTLESEIEMLKKELFN